MTLQWIFIEPHDVWMFRDSKPFAAGESFFARSIFPPPPGTIQGMIRTFYYEQTGRIIGSSKDMGDLRLMGAFLAERSGNQVHRLYPRPLDLLPGSAPRLLAPRQNVGFVTDLGDGWHPLISSDTNEKADKADAEANWLDERNFQTYLAGRSPAALRTDDSLYHFEERTGLAMDHGRRAYRRRRDDSPEGLFYRAAFVRPDANIGLLIGVEYPTPIFEQETGAIAVGGESRMGEYQVVRYTPPTPTVRPGRVKVILQTPAYFRGGWLPDQGWSAWLGDQVTLVSAAVSKPIAISGWDMAAGQPKTLRHFVPAGSVYYFDNAVVPTQPFTETPNDEADFGAIGYGAFAVAPWNYID